MLYSVFKKLGLGEPQPTRVALQLADRSIKNPWGIIEDVLVKVDKFIFLLDFIVLDMQEDVDVPLILRRPFLAMGKAMIDVQQGKLNLRIQDDEIIFKMSDAMKHAPSSDDSCYMIDVIDYAFDDCFQVSRLADPLELCIQDGEATRGENEEIQSMAAYLNANP
ncbi:PREDICTED: uncharacterized protein LOC104590460 [Nelumbo nucifera]|uniref:Uncharacterized protein LOC104590460 n=1 Tax=Nelumbo nucifera TaxID=4432 RepID=A0A1U7Z2S0_NELNU|nr:PREDICTED: uncharacterized protein LOC104590460 [Nelumbo nucifera]